MYIEITGRESSLDPLPSGLRAWFSVKTSNYWFPKILSFMQSVIKDPGRSSPSFPSGGGGLLLPCRRRQHSLLKSTGSRCWTMLSPVPRHVGTLPVGHLLQSLLCCPVLPAPSVLAHSRQLFLYPPYLPSFFVLSSFLLFMSLVKSQFIHFRVTVSSLSQPSFISKPLLPFFCLTSSICKSLSYST